MGKASVPVMERAQKIRMAEFRQTLVRFGFFPWAISLYLHRAHCVHGQDLMSKFLTALVSVDFFSFLACLLACAGSPSVAHAL